MKPDLTNTAINIFEEKFEYPPSHVVSAPGRVNLIGEHTDYSDGFVLPMAIDYGIIVAVHPREDRHLRIFSIDFNQLMEVDLSTIEKQDASWQEYIKGVAWIFQSKGEELRGWDGVLTGNVPIGAGLSSSAALEVAMAQTIASFSGLHLSLIDLAVCSQRAEGEWVGVNVGIMDQMISAAGKENHGLLIDCRSMEIEDVPVPSGAGFVVLDTGTRRELTNSAYNTRRAECEEAARIMGVSILRDANLDLLQKYENHMTRDVYLRARHVITENERVHTFCQSMRDGNLEIMGEILNQCHISLMKDYQVSSMELDSIVDISTQHKGCFGARMTGAGFGGCALALIDPSELNHFREYVQHKYQKETGIYPDIYPVNASDGVKMEKINY